VKWEEMKEPDVWLPCPCPDCGSPLSLLRRTSKTDLEVLIVVTCEFCDGGESGCYEGFVVRTGLYPGNVLRELKRLSRPRKKPLDYVVKIEPLEA